MRDERTILRHVLRELPRRKLDFVLLVVFLNLALVIGARSRSIAHARAYIECDEEFLVAPWRWTSDEWRDTVLPWK